MSGPLSLIAGALIVLGVIIVIHELGHFLVAKLFKIKVETFSVGFGPRLIGYKYGDTDYRISALPLGGYVKMSGENPGDTITGDPREFMSKPKWQRFLVAAAGPAMNLALAGALLTAVFMYGIRVPAVMRGHAIVGYVDPGSPAEQAGIQPGDRIVQFDGKSNPEWGIISIRAAINAMQPLGVTVEREGARIESTLTPERKETNGQSIGHLGMYPPLAVMVVNVLPGKPAEKAGIQPGDEIVSVNSIELKTQFKSFPEILQGIPEPTFPIGVLRQGELKEFPITPVTEEGDSGKASKLIGVQIEPPTVMLKLGFGEAVRESIDQNIENASLIFTVLGKLFKPLSSGGMKVSTLDGPIRIIQISGDAFKQGLGPLLMVMATISLNLGLLNLLPVPILDGGVMLLILIEGLMRRELSLRVKERIVQVSFVALLTLTAFVLYNDVLKVLPSFTGNP